MNIPHLMHHFFNIIFIFVLFSSIKPAMPHGTADSRMDEVNHALQHHPKSARLYLKRGRIHQERQNTDKAMADYQHARQLDKNLHETIYWIGMLNLEEQNYSSAEKHLQEYIHLSNSPLGHISLADLYKLTGKYALASKHYDTAIQLDDNPPPSLFLDRAETLAQTHPLPLPVKLIGTVVSGIQQGMARHGELATYLEFLIHMYQNNGDYHHALSTITRLPKNLRATPLWQFKKADLLLKNGDKKLAEEAYHAAIDSVEKLPEHRRNVKAVSDVYQKAQLALNRLQHDQQK